MKKILLFLVLLFGFLPQLKKGKLSFGFAIYAQGMEDGGGDDGGGDTGDGGDDTGGDTGGGDTGGGVDGTDDGSYDMPDYDTSNDDWSGGTDDALAAAIAAALAGDEDVEITIDADGKIHVVPLWQAQAAAQMAQVAADNKWLQDMLASEVGTNPMPDGIVDLPITNAPPYFTYFDLKGVVTADENARILHPELVNPTATGMYGVACLASYMVGHSPAYYQATIRNLWQVGKTISTNRVLLDGTNDKGSTSSMGFTNPTIDVTQVPIAYPNVSGAKMSEADYIILCCMQNTAKAVGWEPSTWNNTANGFVTPAEFLNLIAALGMHNVQNNTTAPFGSTATILAGMDANFNIGHGVFMYVNPGWLQSCTITPAQFTMPGSANWMSYEGNSSYVNGVVSFDVFCGGQRYHLSASDAVFAQLYMGNLSAGGPQ